MLQDRHAILYLLIITHNSKKNSIPISKQIPYIVKDLSQCLEYMVPCFNCCYRAMCGPLSQVSNMDYLAYDSSPGRGNCILWVVIVSNTLLKVDVSLESNCSCCFSDHSLFTYQRNSGLQWDKGRCSHILTSVAIKTPTRNIYFHVPVVIKEQQADKNGKQRFREWYIGIN